MKWFVIPGPNASLFPPLSPCGSFAQKRGLTPYRKGKPALQPQMGQGSVPVFGQSPLRERGWG